MEMPFPGDNYEMLTADMMNGGVGGGLAQGEGLKHPTFSCLISLLNYKKKKRPPH